MPEGGDTGPDHDDGGGADDTFDNHVDVDNELDAVWHTGTAHVTSFS